VCAQTRCKQDTNKRQTRYQQDTNEIQTRDKQDANKSGNLLLHEEPFLLAVLAEVGEAVGPLEQVKSALELVQRVGQELDLGRLHLRVDVRLCACVYVSACTLFF
jgi:hypothetical protein